MAQNACTSLDALLASAPDRCTVRQKARDLDVVRRSGKVDPYALLMTVVFGIAVRGPTAIAQLGQVMAEATGIRLARSTFWSRFTPSFACLVRWLLNRHVADACDRDPKPPGILAGFKDVIAVDANVVKLHDDLESVWRGTRRNSARAALKVHAWIRVFTGELLKFRITADAYGDCRAFGVEHGLRNTLVLLDRAYSSQSLWRRIQNVGGYFLTRLPADRDPELVRDLRRHRGRSRKAPGLRLRDFLDGLQRGIVDVGAQFRCHVRRYGRAHGRYVDEEFRIVALRSHKTGKYSVFVTNAPPDLLPAEHVGHVYGLRWEIETFFKTAKTGSGLAELPSAKPHIVKALVYASLLRATSAMQALARFRRVVARPAGVQINPGQWMKWWNRQLHRLLEEALDLLRGHLSELQLARMLSDPNVGRPSNRALFRSGLFEP